jgi:uncharacterized membrane protein
MGFAWISWGGAFYLGIWVSFWMAMVLVLISFLPYCFLYNSGVFSWMLRRWVSDKNGDKGKK